MTHVQKSPMNAARTNNIILLYLDIYSVAHFQGYCIGFVNLFLLNVEVEVERCYRDPQL